MSSRSRASSLLGALDADLDFSSGASRDCANGAGTVTIAVDDGPSIPGVSISAAEDCDNAGRAATVIIPVQPEVVGTWTCADDARVFYKDADLGGGVAGAQFTTLGDSSATPPTDDLPCAITIDAVTSTVVEGTFSATVQDNFEGEGAQRSITAGRFSVPPAPTF